MNLEVAFLHEYASPRALVVAVVLVLVAVHLARSTSRAERLRRKLPCPRFTLPVIGHLHLIGSLPHVGLRDLARKHGPDVMLLRLGAVPTLIVSSPSAARAVLRTHDHVFASRPDTVVGDILFVGSTNVGHSPYGEYWRQVRKIITTHVLTAKKIRANLPYREQEARLALASVREAAAAGTAVDLTHLFSHFAHDMVSQAVAGRIHREDRWGKLFHDLFVGNGQLLGGFNLDDCFPSLARLGIGSANIAKQRKRWDDLLDEVIDRHTSTPMEKGDEPDFIDVMLSVQDEYKLTRNNIKSILMDMFQAGTDTTFIWLDYAMAELARAPQVMAKLQAEVRRCSTTNQLLTQEDLSSMSYLKAVMKETMRLHPPGPLLLPHASIADCEVEGYVVPAGTRVIINVWAIGRHASSWERAEEFVPERFLEGSVDANSDFYGNDFRLLPFGSGRRMCPGINFATLTFEIILANLIYHFDWELPEGSPGVDMTEAFGMDVHRKENLLLVPRVAKIV
uniref:Putative cytochrome P450 n=1 Tax=Lolium rigidum TaxID=89674 RepID=Q9ATV3_LOLRI|nr:putative cytochrome P450 [Lolium rigidum]